MPTPRRDFGIATDADGNIYAVGGYGGYGYRWLLNVVEMYDPKNDTWMIKSQAPVLRNSMGFTFNPTNNNFYFTGGYNEGVFNDVYEYNPTSDTWTAKTPMPSKRFGLRLVVGSNGKLYAVGGKNDAGLVDAVEEYDPITNLWTTKNTIPTPRSNLGLVAAPNGMIYAIGGDNDQAHYFNIVEEYNPITNTWITKNPMPTARSDMGVSLNSEGNIVVAGGYADNGAGISGYTNVVEEYNPTTDTWTTKTPLPVATYALGLALAGDGNLYAIGGQTESNPVINSNYVGIKSSEIDLNVPLIKQTSDPWQSQIYDSANRWSPLSPTIRDWGCAMTSAVMILKYYGINKLPDNTDINPGSLNTWLNNQPDGYVGDGLTNWIAISRLSKLAKTHNPDFKYGALEFSKIWGDDKNQLTNDIKNNQPDILEVPGHFIVGKGIKENTFNINDPYYDRLTLEDYSNTFLTLNRYIPSDSDLSYIMLTSEGSLKISFKDSSNNPLGVQFTQQPLVNDSDNSKTSGKPLEILYVQKPDGGDYQVYLTAENLKIYELKIYLYDQEGNVNIKNQKGILDPAGQDIININLDKNDSSNSSIKKIVTFQSTINDVNRLRKLNLILNNAISKNLINLIKNAEKDFTKRKKTALLRLNAFEFLINSLRGIIIKEEAYQILDYDIKYLKNN
ncbi:MAG: C39 family peptidase [Patescibacteria group bacterium]|nr:C39 family peptidase [Patescibacteria group bacterium]